MTAAANEVRAKHATALAEHEEERATAQAQLEADQAERAEEQAEEHRANEATYVAQLAGFVCGGDGAGGFELVREATAQAESVEESGNQGFGARERRRFRYGCWWLLAALRWWRLQRLLRD